MSLIEFFKGLFGNKPEPIEPADDYLALPPRMSMVPEATGPVDFIAVFDRAGVDIEQRLRVKKAQDLLQTLPKDGPPDVKRQIVEAAFTAFDIPTHKIVSSASAEIDALAAFTALGEKAKQEALDDGERRVAELDREIANVRAAMAQAVADQEECARVTREEVTRIEPVIRFFAHEAITKLAAETTEMVKTNDVAKSHSRPPLAHAIEPAS